MKRLLKIVAGMILVIFLTTAYSAAPKATEFAPDYSALVEVCDQSGAYIPPGTRYVTCQGRVMRVLGIVPKTDKDDRAEANGAGDCYCPRCCDGACAVIVTCGSGGGMCVLYLACGD
ncbi:MAG: hypothetical protein A2W03_18665 [Candidatus Aminicenantes bacterium RBG_16_63_16]|nr:MAG: hypothetical protein A2W03_18665 [Candidatus Aminicenantes bacterium RBG_16_63_16]